MGTCQKGGPGAGWRHDSSVRGSLQNNSTWKMGRPQETGVGPCLVTQTCAGRTWPHPSSNPSHQNANKVCTGLVSFHLHPHQVSERYLLLSWLSHLLWKGKRSDLPRPCDPLHVRKEPSVPITHCPSEAKAMAEDYIKQA